MPIRRERCEVDRWGFAQEKLRHDTCGAGCEKDAVAIVAGGDEMVRMAGDGAKQGKTVESCGTETGPDFELWGIG